MAAEEQVDRARDKKMRWSSEKGEANEDAVVCGGEQTAVNEREKKEVRWKGLSREVCPPLQTEESPS